MNMIKFASFISYLTALMNSCERGKLAEHEIETVKTHLDSLIDRQIVNLTPLFDAITNYRKIDAIKEYRALTGEGLLESKNAVEKLYNKLKLEQPIAG